MYEQYADDIFRYIYVHVHDVELAEDITADTFSRALQKIDTFDFSNGRAWLYKIATNLVTDHWRKKKAVPLDEPDDIIDERQSIEVGVDAMLAHEQLSKALWQISAQERAVLQLRFMQGKSARDTAQELRISEANVRVIQFRALKRLKGLLS